MEREQKTTAVEIDQHRRAFGHGQWAVDVGLDGPPGVSRWDAVDIIRRSGDASPREIPHDCSDQHGKQLVPHIGQPRHDDVDRPQEPSKGPTLKNEWMDGDSWTGPSAGGDAQLWTALENLSVRPPIVPVWSTE